MSPTFEILVHDTRVATLHAEPKRETCNWITDWDPAWVNASPRPVASLKLLDLRLNRPRAWGPRLPPFLTNLLPNADTALRRRLARTHDLREDDDVAFLALLGGDLSGAVRVRTIDPLPAPARARPAPNADPLFSYRTSLGGMQLKFSAHRGDRISLPAHGELSEWILKLPSSERPRLPAWEAAALSWARAVGFEVPEHHVEPVSRVDGLPEDVQRSGGDCLVVRRFDRPGGEQRVHMEEVCSVLGLHPEAMYAEDGQPYNLTSVGRVVHQFAGRDDAATFLQRVLFDALIGNGDAHLKNWALTFPDRHHARLAPVYDLVPTAVFLDDRRLALALHGSRKPTFEQVHPHTIRELAQRMKLDPVHALDTAAALVRRTEATFEAAVEPWALTSDERTRWRAHLERVARHWR